MERYIQEMTRYMKADEQNNLFMKALINFVLSEEVNLGNGVFVNLLTHKVYKDGKPVPLTSTETAIIEMLARQKNEVVTYEDIIEYIWGYAEDNSILKVNVSHIRNKINIPIISIKGIGYKLGDE